MPKKSEPVENFRITPEQKAFTKRYKQVATARRLVQRRLMEHMAGAQEMQNLLGQMQTRMQEMINKAPRKQTIDLEGQ
jgi:F0F1-type ATP synthase membrane subunit b/b'